MSTDAGILIEPLTPDDWPAVCAIYEAGIAAGDATFESEAPSWEAWDAAHRADCRFVARDASGTVLGWVAVSHVSKRRVYAGVVEESVYVAPEAQGRGVGRALLETLIAATEAAGIWTIQAGIFPENVASLALHERVGFRRVGVHERLGRDRTGRWRDVVLLERRSRVVGVEPLVEEPRVESWRDLILNVQPEAEFAPPASAEEIEAAETLLGIRLPSGLRSLLSESNGVKYGLRLPSGDCVVGAGRLVWPLGMIVEENRRMSDPDVTSRGPRQRRALFFADAGADGILFGHPILPSGDVAPAVVVWHPIDDELTPSAASLAEYLIRWSSGELAV